MITVYILILIGGGLSHPVSISAVPREFMDLPSCQSTGEAWRVLAKDEVWRPRYVCVPRYPAKI